MKIPKRFRTPKARVYYAALCGVGAVLLSINLGLSLYYRERTFPKTTLAGKPAGNQTLRQLETTIDQSALLPKEITFSHANKTAHISTDELGVSVDKASITNQAKKHSRVALLEVFRRHELMVETVIDEAKLAAQIDRLSTTFTEAPQNATLALENNSFVLKPAVDGYSIKADELKNTILSAVKKNATTVAIPVATQTPTIATASLEPELQKLQSQTKTTITLTYESKTTQPTSQEIASWYTAAETTFIPVSAAIRSYVQKVGGTWGITVDNLSDATSEIEKAIASNKNTTVTLVARKIVRSYSYCVATRGVDTAHLGGFSSKLATVYANAKGWSLNNQVAFTKVASGCHFTVWLSAASQMATFGGLCDPAWSCRNGNNVVINFDRWMYATTAWNNAGGSLDDYRSMVINHETGHWFGFDHRYCGGAGQLAPVMQQQSISLGGCIFNPWPTSAEFTSLRHVLGI